MRKIMGGTNYKQKNLLKDLIYLGQTKPINKQTIKGLFRFALEPLLENQTQKTVVFLKLRETAELEGVLKRIEFTNTEVYSFDNVTQGENLSKADIWGDTEFLVLLSPRYSACLLWDYSTETIKDTSCVYYLLNSKDVNNVVKIISDNSKIDLMRYTQEFTPERRSNELLNCAIHKFINFTDSFVEEVSLSKAEVDVLGVSDDIAKKYDYILSKTKLISHDIKNHLSVIDLYSKIIEKRLHALPVSTEVESMNKAVLSINKSKDSITALLNQLKSIQGVDLQALNFEQVLNHAIDLATAKAQQFNITFELEEIYKGNILADENKILNVMLNLFYNSIDAIGENGFIKIATKITDDNMLKIFVGDSGCGIEENLKNKIFEEGYTSKSTGSGLGLYISKEAMKEQYGDLNLIDSNQSGTTFEIVVPKL